MQGAGNTLVPAIKEVKYAEMCMKGEMGRENEKEKKVGNDDPTGRVVTSSTETERQIFKARSDDKLGFKHLELECACRISRWKYPTD